MIDTARLDVAVRRFPRLLRAAHCGKPVQHLDRPVVAAIQHEYRAIAADDAKVAAWTLAQIGAADRIRHIVEGR